MVFESKAQQRVQNFCECMQVKKGVTLIFFTPMHSHASCLFSPFALMHCSSACYAGYVLDYRQYLHSASGAPAKSVIGLQMLFTNEVIVEITTSSHLSKKTPLGSIHLLLTEVLASQVEFLFISRKKICQFVLGGGGVEKNMSYK